MGEDREDDKEKAEGTCDDEINAGEIGEIEGVLYCFHPKSPRGRTTMMTK